MILTCPSCGTQYVVKDGAIPPEGRQVRCASCKHSWHQHAEPTPGAPADQPALSGAEPPSDVEAGAPTSEPVNDADGEPEAAGDNESLAEASLIDPRSGPEAEERAYEEAVIESDASAPEPAAPAVEAAPIEVSAPEEDWKEPPHTEAEDDEFSPFPPPDAIAPRPRRGVAPFLIIALLIVVAAAAFWLLAPPEWKARLGLAAIGSSPLALVTTHMDRQQLESGNELLTVTGRVINPTSKEQDVPPVQAQLKTKAGKIVYSWTIAPPARTLGPGASASFNSAEVNVPPGGDELTLTLGGGK